MIFQIILQIAD